jgi:hypothetical protein
MFIKIIYKMKIITLFVLLSYSVFSQDLHHQMISSQGKSTILSNGMLVSQTIGQQSAIGNHTKGVTVGQGFQQSHWAKYVNSNTSVNIATTTYPNPFITTVNFQFSQQIKETIEIAVFDVRGRLIFQDKKRATDSVLTVELPQLASSNYLVRLTAPNYTYYSQILKQ